MAKRRVAVVFGSDSDWPVMEACVKQLRAFDVEPFVEDGQIRGVGTRMNVGFLGKSVILTTGTFLRGKIYVGEVAGTYHILDVSKEACTRLHSVNFVAEDGSPIEIFGTPTVAGSAVLLPTRTDLYCIAADGGSSTPPSSIKSWNEVEVVQIRPAETWVE